MEGIMGRKPVNPAMGARSAADRKREQIARQWERINTQEESSWTESDCFLILQTTRYRGGAMDRAAWRQLGQLRGYV